MTGFEPRISGAGSDRSTNWATTTAQNVQLLPDYTRCKNLNANTPTKLRLKSLYLPLICLQTFQLF